MKVFFCCLVKDNCEGVDPLKYRGSFERKDPTPKAAALFDTIDTEENIISFKEWGQCGGFAKSKFREDGVKGCVIELKIPCISSQEKVISENPALNAKIQTIKTWKEDHPDRKVIVIADDCLVTLKVLTNKVINFLYSKKYQTTVFKDIARDKWQEEGLVFDCIENTAFVFCANAGNALTLIKNLPCDVLITDVQMPGSFDGIGLVHLIREHEKNFSHTHLPILIHSAKNSEELLSEDPHLAWLEVEFFLKGTNYSTLERFLTIWTK